MPCRTGQEEAVIPAAAPGRPRLNRQSQFDAVRKTGHSAAGRYCVVNILESPPDNTGRAAFSISRRYSRLAVERNRARRLFREAYRRMAPSLAGAWIVFVPRRAMKKASMGDVLADAVDCVRRASSKDGSV